MEFDFQSADVKTVFDGYALPARGKLLSIRNMIFEVAVKNNCIGPIEESLKWGQPSYSPVSKSGSPVRLGIEKKTINKVGLYVHCGTTLIETFKHIYPDEFIFSGNRALLFGFNDDLPDDPLRHVITIALTYYLKD